MSFGDYCDVGGDDYGGGGDCYGDDSWLLILLLASFGDFDYGGGDYVGFVYSASSLRVEH